MSETEPSAPLPEDVGRRMAEWFEAPESFREGFERGYTAALAAATERATRAEAEVVRLRASVINLRADTLQAEEREDQARAQVAKVRALRPAAARSGTGEPISVILAGDLAAALGPVGATGVAMSQSSRQGSVGATEGCRIGWVLCASEDGGTCTCTPPASPAAAEPERDVPFRCRVCGWVEGEAP